MTYLYIFSNEVWTTTDMLDGKEVGGVYQIPADLEALYSKWRSTPSYMDGLLSGIIADWLEENIETLIPVKPDEERLRSHIDKLRLRFTSATHNRATPDL